LNTLRLHPLTADAMSPFGSIIEAPTNPGDRTGYTQWLGSDRTGMTPRLHTNSLLPAVLPYAIHVLERHPYSAQVFLPLDVAQYVVVVAPTADEPSSLREISGWCTRLPCGMHRRQCWIAKAASG
jgi:ureidoglycolate lyase